MLSIKQSILNPYAVILFPTEISRWDRWTKAEGLISPAFASVSKVAGALLTILLRKKIKKESTIGAGKKKTQ